ncbi:hypothetical protein Q8A67_015118 [Cirrhinus molitorella]|uniref:Uncharacterized protein n=1 Tax=Cirrhinus molitorella TaxID=172907 RepID=A0AA88PJ61_9TELE|nr:hypothetical protein Q8A67_015118 [Cirrhinus molitorella]
MAQQCAAQELAALEKLPEAFDSPAKNEKRRKRRRQYIKKEEERQAKEREKDKAEKERETLSLEMVNVRGHAQQSAKFRDMQSLGNSMEGESERREAGEKKRKKRKLKQPETTKPAPLLVEVKPLQTPPVRATFLTPIEADRPMLPSDSEHLQPAAHFKPLLPVTKQPMCPQKPEEVTLPGTPLLVHPPKPLLVRPRPTPAPEELFSLRCSSRRLVLPLSSTPGPEEVVALQRSSARVCPLSLVQPQLSTSYLFEPPPELMLIDIEDEENEYVEYTGKTIQRPQLLEARINPRMAAWVESDSELLEEVVEDQGFEEDSNDSNETQAIQGHSDVTCITSPKNETQQHVNIQGEPQRKTKVSLFLLTWVEEKAKEKEERKIQKEKEQRDKEMLLQRYRNDPKLKHLIVNKHNHHYRSSE